MVIRFQPRKLSTKPDVLTRCWDVYPKEGSSDYASINPQNLRPIFTDEQLASSLHATTFWLPALRGSLIMDTERLQADIVSSLQSDPTALEHLSDEAESQWTTIPDGLLRLDDCIYVGTLTSHPPVCPRPPIIGPLQPVKDPRPGPPPLHLAQTQRICAPPAPKPSRNDTSPTGC